MITERIKAEIIESSDVKRSLERNEFIVDQIRLASEMVINCIIKGGKTIFAGNGGSAADSQHLAAEFVSRYLFNRPALPSLALTTDTSIITAIGNDYGYELLFARQLEAMAKPDDVFIAISTSGSSKNIIEALKFCKKNRIASIGLTGAQESIMDEYCDLTIHVPSLITARIQESHILIGHIICGIVEGHFYANDLTK